MVLARPTVVLIQHRFQNIFLTPFCLLCSFRFFTTRKPRKFQKASRKFKSLDGELKINQIYLKIVTQGFLGSLITAHHSDLKNSKWRIHYGGQVNLINFYKPRPPYWIRVLRSNNFGNTWSHLICTEKVQI